MKTAVKVGIVLGGYAGALLVTAVVIFLRFLVTADDPSAQGSSGMYAFGDLVLFVFVFGIAALVPTGFALYFLRPVRQFWTVASICAATFAATALAASLLFWTTRSQPATHSFVSTAEEFSLERLLVAPLFSLAFLVSALFAPAKLARSVFALAATLEAVAVAPWVLWGAYNILSR